MLPNFLIIGAPKCGTTSLWSVLKEHPDIFMVEEKEIYFFSDNSIFSNGIPWYEDKFKNAGDKKIVGEATANYSVIEDAPHRISKILPEAKILYVVRHPVKQIESYYLHLKSSGIEHNDFNDAILKDGNYIKTANYGYWRDQYNVFHQNGRLKAVFFEDFVADPVSVLKSILNFLDLDTSLQTLPYKTHKNKTSDKYEDRKIIRFLRKNIYLTTKLDKMIQGDIRTYLKPVFRKKIFSRPEWNNEAKIYVQSSLEKKTQDFLKTFGKPTDFWPF